MSIEIIRRKEGELSQKQQIKHENTQFSVNSYGHLCIREFDNPYTKDQCELGCESGYDAGCAGKNERGDFNCFKCEYYKTKEMQKEEHLVVIDAKTTAGLIEFIFQNRNTYEYKQFLKELIKSSDNLPY